jgi:AcrR family transcriptional regulator
MERVAHRIPACERRQQILAVATALFARRGFHGTTTREIAEQVGVQEVILFRLYPSKEELYWAVMEAKCDAAPGVAGLKELLAAGRPDKEVFTTLAAGLIERNRKDASLLRLLLFCALEEHKLMDRFTSKYMAVYYETLAAYIGQRIKAGAFRAVDPVLAARGFLGMVFHHVMSIELFGIKAEPQKVAAAFTDVWLKGIQLKESKV